MHRPFRFSPPPTLPSSILRPRLLREVGARFEQRLVTICAGAGLGKTTLLAQALAENALDPRGTDCWLTCEPGDASPSVLLDALLRAVGAPPSDELPTVERVCAAVWSAAPGQVAIVVDDAHLIDASSDGALVFRQLLDALPDNGHLVIAGRQLPPLPSGRLVLEARAGELTEAALRLDDDELVAFAGRNDVAVDLLDGAAGWPALVELRARMGTADAERYAWEEVVEPLRAAEREAFTLIVALGGADAASIAAIVDEPFDAVALARLPLVATDESGGLRAHPLWNELLRPRLDAHTVDAARARLARVMSERGDHARAFELFATNEDWDAALGALFEACNDQNQPPWRDQMARWRTMVPEAHRARPEVVYADAMVGRATDPWSPETIEGFTRAMDGFRGRNQVVQELVAMVRASYLAWLRADRTLLDSMHARAAEIGALGYPVTPILQLNRALVVDIGGRPLTDAPAIEEHDIEPRLRHTPGVIRSFIRLGAGDADSCVDDAAAAAGFGRPVEPAAVTGWARALPAVVDWGCGRLPDSTLLTDPGRRYSNAERTIPVALAAIVSAHHGNSAAARAALAQLDEIVPEIGPRDLLAGFHAIAAAAVALADGDETAARAVLAAELDGRDLAPGGAGRAVLWWPSLPYLLNDRARASLDALDHGPSRQRTLTACRALVLARAGTAPDRPELLDDTDALLSALPVDLATELLVHVSQRDPASELSRPLEALVAVSPEGVRRTLRRLADADNATLARSAKQLLAAVPIPPAAPVRIEVFGETRLLRDGIPVTDAHWRRARVRQLACLLVTHGDIRRSRVGTLLWPDRDEESVSANLRITLSYLQNLFEPDRTRGDATWFLRQDAGFLRLARDERLSVDAWEFDEHVEAAATAARAASPSIELGHLQSALTLYRGEYLDDAAGEEWAEPLRAAMRDRVARTAVRAGELLVAAGRSDEALAAAMVAIRADPYGEAAYRVGMRALAAADDRDGALRLFAQCTQRLSELDVEPERDTITLASRLR